MLKHPILIVFGIIVLVLSGFTVHVYQRNQAQSSGWGNQAPIVVDTVRADMAMISDTIESIGTTQANESVSLTSKITDTVSRVNFEDGAEVAAGDVLVELTNAVETAQLNEAKATLIEAERQFERVQDLVRQNMTSEGAVDEARVRQQTAQARLEGILARLDDRLIRAPFNGTVGFRNVSPGTLLTTNTVVTTLDDISVVKLDFTIPENYLAAIENGQNIVAKSAAYPDRQFVGKVATINSRVDPVTRAVGVRAILQNNERLLRPGMLLTVTLDRASSEGLVIPEESIIPIQSREYVYVVSPENRVERVEVETGRRQKGVVEVVAGLDIGDEVVTQGVIKLRPGATVTRRQSG